MLKISMNWDGDEFKRKVRQAAHDGMIAQASEKTKNLRCATHHERARVVSTKELSYTITACCEPFKAEVIKALKSN